MSEKLTLLSFISIMVVFFGHSAPYSLICDGVEMKQPSAVAKFFFHLWDGSFGRVKYLLSQPPVRRWGDRRLA